MADETQPIGAAPPKRQRPFLSLRAKVLFGITVLFSVIFVIAFAWFSRLAQNIALQRLIEDIEGTLSGATAGVDAETLVSLANDAHRIAGEIAEEEGIDLQTASKEEVRAVYLSAAEELQDDPRYEALLDFEQEVQDIEPRAWPYIYVPGPGPDNAYVAIADLWIRYDPDRAFEFLWYTYSTKGFLIEAFDPDLAAYPEGYVPNDDNLPQNNLADVWGRLWSRIQPEEGEEIEPIWDEVGYTDEWGTWISAYAPIRDENGESVGAMGIDFRAEYVRQVTGEIQQQVLLVFGVGYAVFLIAAIFMAAAFTGPISSLASSAERIGEGDYDQDIADMSVGPYRDELTVLANVFEIMIDKVHRREQNLRRQVEELRIQIDEKKRGEQVAEIVETEFFRDLRDKARVMRARGKRTDREDE
jgi:HAMP domain-containing protein